MQREKAKKSVLLALICVLSFSGCESWRRPAAEQDVPVSAPVDSQSQEEELPEVDFTEMESAVVTKHSDESVFWSTEDEVLSRKLYDLLTCQNELFSEKFDEREYDFLAVITDEEGTVYRFSLWINFERENEIIVEDEQGTQWNLSIENSNHVRSLLSGWR